MSAPRKFRHSFLTSLRLNFLSTLRLIRTLRQGKLGLLVPLVVILLFLAVILYFANLVSPLAPFIYSLI